MAVLRYLIPFLAVAVVVAPPCAAHALTSMTLSHDAYRKVLHLQGDRYSYCGGCVYRPPVSVTVGATTITIDVGDAEPELCFAVGQPWAADVVLPDVPGAEYELRIRDFDAWDPLEGSEVPLFATLRARLFPGSGVSRDGFEESPPVPEGSCNF